MSEVGQILQATTRDISVSRHPAEEAQRDMDSYSVCPGNTLCTRGSGLKNDADLFISMDEGGKMIRSRSPTG